MTLDASGRFTVAVAGLLGAAGVVAAAGSSHAGDTRLIGSLALIALTHAPSLLALALLGGGRPFRVATLVLSLGALLFCADLAMRHLTGGRLFPMSAPIGGAAMIAGWLLVATAGVFARKH